LRNIRYCLLFLCLLACSLAAPDRGELLSGSTTVAKATFEVRVRHTDLVQIPVFFPAEPDGRPRGSSLPAVVFIQGGLVATEDYSWLGETLADAGHVVVFPEHVQDLAFFAIDNGNFARELLVSPPRGSLLDGLVDESKIAAIGHSLGGVVAVKLALDGGFDSLALLASFADPNDESLLGNLGLPMLSLAAENDCDADLATVTEGFAAFVEPKVLAVLEGATHYQFTDSDTIDQTRGCASTVSLEEAHARAGEVLRLFLEGAHASQSVDPTALAGVEGVVIP
jgi:dienelactone hydrolase